MGNNAEFRVHSISVPPQTGGVDLLHLFDNLDWGLTGKLTLVQIRFDNRDLTAESLGALANRAFGIRPLKPEEISENHQIPAAEDFAFATEFGFTLIPHLASLGLAADGAIETWIGPALVPSHHPLADKQGTAVALFTDPNITSRSRFLNGENVRSLQELNIARYIRLTVDDQPLVLADTLGAIAQEEINIHELRQPEPEKGNPTAQLAAISNPCSGESFGNALNAIRALPSCRIDTVLPVVGLGRLGSLQDEKD